MPRNPEKFLHHFEEYEISREQKLEIIDALYAIAENFADLAFGVHPMQMGQDDPMAMWDEVVRMLESDLTEDDDRAIFSEFIAHISTE
jgi:hypothetical protein